MVASDFACIGTNIGVVGIAIIAGLYVDLNQAITARRFGTPIGAGVGVDVIAVIAGFTVIPIDQAIAAQAGLAGDLDALIAAHLAGLFAVDTIRGAVAVTVVAGLFGIDHAIAA